jgi:SAM-dependent methyltransferase
MRIGYGVRAEDREVRAVQAESTAAPRPHAGSEAFTPAAVQERLTGFRVGAAVSLAIALGDELGLYRAMDGGADVRPDELSDAVGLDRTLVGAWLGLQAVAGIVEEPEPGRYRLPRAVARCLASDEGLPSMTGMFAIVPWEGEVFDALAASFRDGGRLAAGRFGDRYHASRDRARHPWLTGGFLRLVVPRASAADAVLRAGGRAADVGCGAGASTLALAERFPDSRFVGVDVSGAALARARSAARSAGAANVEFVQAEASALAGLGPFDVATTLDCMHEIGDPDAVGAAVREALAPDGTWLIEDFRPLGADRAAERSRAAMLLHSSLLVCLHSENAPASGALSFDSDRARGMAAAAGFASVRVHDVGHPLYLHYELRG